MPAAKVGVTKLNETNAMVEGLKEDLTKLEPILEQASKDAEKLLKQVEIDKADAAKVKEKVRVGPLFPLVAHSFANLPTLEFDKKG